MKIGVGVEGPSDKIFFSKVLPKFFQEVRFDIRSLNGRPKLIRESTALLRTFHRLGYDAGFIIIDSDRIPQKEEACISAAIDLFDETIQNEFKKDKEERYFNIFIVISEIESWYLADDTAINKVLSGIKYKAQSETGFYGTKGVIENLMQQQYGKNVKYREKPFADEIAPHFNPEEAKKHSASFAYFWERLSDRIESVTKKN